MAEPTVNQLVATTINNYHKNFADNVTNSNAVTALLRRATASASSKAARRSPAR